MNTIFSTRGQPMSLHARRALTSLRAQQLVRTPAVDSKCVPTTPATWAAPRALSGAAYRSPQTVPTSGPGSSSGSGRWGLILGGVIAGAGAAALAYSGDEDERFAFALGAYGLPIGKKFPELCNCFIEVSRESRMKYEWDEAMNMLKLDRVLHGAAFYPHDYGFIPQTLCGDGDPLDVLVLGTSALQPGAIVDIRPLGYMVMEDEKGLDEKVLAVPAKDPRFNHMHSLRDVPEHVLREISNFFETYKQLEKSKWVKVGGWKGTADTHDLIEQTHNSYLTAKKNEARMAV